MDKISKLEQQIAKKKAELIREKGKLSQKARKERTRKLIQIGGLAEVAGLSDADAGFILGHMLRAKDIDEGSGEYRSLKAKGDALLKEREAERKRKAKAANNG